MQTSEKTSRRPLAALAFVLILGTQLIVPIVQLPKDRPAHFGWHMFCDWRPIPTYWIVLPDGSTREIDINEHIGVRRLDADYHSVFPQYLRQAYPEAVAVRWQWPRSDDDAQGDDAEGDAAPSEVQEWRWER